jgi:quinol monooxygenase YgiN
MATLLAHITVKPGCEAQFEEIARTLYERTHAAEADVVRYEYWRGAAPGTYYTLLGFTDHRAFIAHQTSDHHESASPAICDSNGSTRSVAQVTSLRRSCRLHPTGPTS